MRKKGIPAAEPIPGAASVSEGILTAGGAPGGGGLGFLPALAFAGIPVFQSGSNGSPATPVVPTFPSPPGPGTPVPEPLGAFLLLAGLITIPVRKHLIK